MSYAYEDHLDGLRREMDDMERGAAGMERQMDKLIYENRDLRTRIQELELEVLRLTVIEEAARKVVKEMKGT